MTKAATIRKIVKEMIKDGAPQRLAIRFNNLALVPGYAIEDGLGLAIGETYPSLEAAHEAHSKAWHKAWESVV